MSAGAGLLTEAQEKWLLRFDVHDRLSRPYMTAFARHSFEKMMQRLCDQGYVRPYPHGGWELTSMGANLVADMRSSQWPKGLG